MNKTTTQRTIALTMLSITAVIWGAGFVFADDLLAKGFGPVPGLQNAIRFGIGTSLLILLFFKQLNITKKTFLYGLVGGTLLFGGFQLQLQGQNFISPAHCGFFTAIYFVMVPVIEWIAKGKAPKLAVFVAVVVAVAGLLILNIGDMPTKEEIWGIVMTVVGAFLFACQIVWSDHLMKQNKTDHRTLLVTQLIIATALFTLYSVIFESKHYSTLQIDVGDVWWELAIISLFGTAFAYYSQTFAQKIISPAQTSLILACESPLGAIISLAIGRDVFSWNIIVGGVLVIASVFLTELVPIWQEKRQAKIQSKRDNE